MIIPHVCVWVEVEGARQMSGENGERYLRIDRAVSFPWDRKDKKKKGKTRRENPRMENGSSQDKLG